MDIGRAAFQEGGQVQQLRRNVNSFERKQAFRVSGDVLTKSQVYYPDSATVSLFIQNYHLFGTSACGASSTGQVGLVATWKYQKRKLCFHPTKESQLKDFQPGSNKVCPNKTKKTHKMCKKRLQL